MTFLERVLEAVGGIPSPRPAGVARYLSLVNYVSTGTPVKITYDDSTLVGGITLVSDEFVVPEDGMYFLAAAANLDCSPATKEAIMFLQKNGLSITGSGKLLTVNSGDRNILSASAILNLTTNDSISLWLSGQNSVWIEAAVPVLGGPSSAGVVFSIIKL